ncbi:MAG TPA: sulfotransferase [Sphingobium sp.]|uniref:sulfotransferase n=1 Tax=Sphingobium sp. TaxID=1912891 RepID=UPI002ED63FD9
MLYMLKRCAVVILGMHRSGTSALTRMLGLMGCTLPATLVPANRTNPAGHWESQPICDFNDELFAAAGTHWLDWLPFNADFRQSIVWPELRERARSLLRSEFGKAPLFAIKDPRMCRLADLWIEALDAENVEPAIVLMLRHPLEVSSSLVSGGYPVDYGYGQLLWLRHILSAEAATRNRRRSVVTFDMLMSNWEDVADKLTARLGVHWPQRTQATVDEVDTFLTPKLRHHNVSSQTALDKRLRSWVADTYEILSRWAEQGENPQDYPALDALMETFDATAPVFARTLIAATEARQEAMGLKSELATSFQARDEAIAARDAALGEVAATQLLLDERAAAEQARLESEEEARQETDKLRHELAVAQSRCIQREEQLAQIEAQGAAERADLEALQLAIQDAKNENARLTRLLAEADQWVFHLAGERKAADDASRRIEAASARNVRLANEEVAKARSELQQALTIADERVTAADARAKAIERDSELALAEASRRIQSNANSQMAAIEQELADTQMRLDAQMRERYKEIAILTGLLRAREEEAAALTHIAEQARSDGDRRIAAADERAAIVEARLANAERETSELQGRWDDQMNDRRNEITALEGLLREREGNAVQVEVAVELGKIATALNKLPKWWAFVPRSMRAQWEEERLRHEGIFDADAYRAANPDVATAGVSPVRHYLSFGLIERRTGIR